MIEKEPPFEGMELVAILVHVAILAAGFLLAVGLVLSGVLF